MPLVSLYEIIHLRINTQSSVEMIRAAATDFESGFTGLYRINYNVVGWHGKIIIKRCHHFPAFRRCVTHRRKEV